MLRAEIVGLAGLSDLVVCVYLFWVVFWRVLGGFSGFGWFRVVRVSGFGWILGFRWLLGWLGGLDAVSLFALSFGFEVF